MAHKLFVNIGGDIYVDLDEIESFGPLTEHTRGTQAGYKTLVVLKSGNNNMTKLTARTVKKRIQRVINYRSGVQFEEKSYG